MHFRDMEDLYLRVVSVVSQAFVYCDFDCIDTSFYNLFVEQSHHFMTIHNYFSCLNDVVTVPELNDGEVT